MQALDALALGLGQGSLGVEHGSGLVQELLQFLDCGMSMEQVLRSASTLPRRLWGAESAHIRAGNRADLACLDGDPFVDREALLRVAAVVHPAGVA